MKDNWLAVAAVACVVGALFGYNIGAGGDGDEEVSKRLGQIEERLASLDGLETANSSIAELTSANETIMGELSAVKEGLGGLESGLQALPGSIDDLSKQVAKLEGGSEAVREDVAAAFSATSSAVDGVTSELQAVVARFAAIEAAAVSPVAAPPSEAQAADVAEAPTPEVDMAAGLRSAIGENGVILSVGQTGVVGEARLFLSRLDEQAAHLVVVGGERITLGAFDSAKPLKGGCAVSLEGVHERKAYIAADCS